MSAFLRLPNETILSISVHLPHSALAALVRVNRRLHDVVEHLLYAEITILDVIDAPPHALVTPSRTLACCAAVRARTYLAAHTRRISIRWSRDRARAHTPARFTADVFPALYYLLAAAAPSLDVLELHLAGLPLRFDLYPLLVAVQPARLSRLALSGAPDADTVGLERILRAHRTLRDLHLGGDTVRRPLALTPNDLPRLTTFRGDARIATSILPGRPVTTLTLSSGAEPSEAFLRACACTALPIRRLDLSALAVTPTQLLAISKHLTQLHALRMRLALRHTLHFTFSGMVSTSHLLLLNPLPFLFVLFAFRPFPLFHSISRRDYVLIYLESRFPFPACAARRRPPPSLPAPTHAFHRFFSGFDFRRSTIW